MKRREAKALGLVYYNTGKPCRNGHSADRIVSKGICRQCALEHSRLPAEKTRRAEYAKSTKVLEGKARYRQSEQFRVTQRAWTKQHWADHAAQRVGYQIAADFGRPANRHVLPEHWPAMNAFYSAAREQGLTVDHIVPLRGETVSGLHVLHNLQALSRADNSRKRNVFVPET